MRLLRSGFQDKSASGSPARRFLQWIRFITDSTTRQLFLRIFDFLCTLQICVRKSVAEPLHMCK